MAISGGDLTNMRAGNQLVIPHLNVTPKVTIATMRVNQTSFTYPLAQLTVDNISMNGGIAFADIPIGSLIYIGTAAGLHDVSTSVVRKAPSGTTLFISAVGPGDPGYAMFEHTALADDQYITVLAVKPVWSLISRIASQVFYKKYDVPYVDEGDDPPPVCNIGPWKRLDLTGASVTEPFTNAAITDVKPASFAWGSKTKSSYAWTTRNSSYALNTGATFDGGVDNTEGVSITFATAGFYIVYCTLTDSGGKTHTAETYVWVVDGSAEKDVAGWYLESDEQTRQGRKMTVGIHGDTAESVVYPGAAYLYTEEQTYNDATVTAGATVTTFAGYIKMEKPARQITHGKTTFEVVAPSILLEDVPNASQYIIEDATPANWTEVTSDLTHASGIAWYLLQHHTPQMLQAFDFAPLVEPGTSTLDTNYRDRTWLFSGRSLWAQISEIMKHQINIGCDSQGALYLRHKPDLMDSADRNAIDDRMTWGVADIRESLEYTSLIRNQIGIVDAYAFSYDGATIVPYWSRSPSDAQAQGKTINTVNGMIVPSATAQTRLNEMSGHLFASANNPTPRLQIKTMRNFDTADPARMVWHTVNVGSAYDPRGVGWSNHRAIPEKVTRKWERTPSGVWLKRIDITMQPETTGQPGLTKEVPISQEGDFGLWDDFFDPFGWGDIITDFPPIDLPDPGANLNTIVGVNNDGNLYRTSDFTTVDADGGPTWDQVASGVAGTPLQFVVDPYSPLYTGTGTNLNGWIVTSTAIYRMTDLLGVAPGAALQHSHANVPAGIFADFSIAEQGWGIVAYATAASGVFTTYTTDNGATWSADALVTAFIGPGGTPGLYVSQKTPGLAYVGGWSSTGGHGVAQGAIYRSTDYGATWSAYAGISNNLQDRVGQHFHVPYALPDELTLFYATSVHIVANDHDLSLTKAVGAGHTVVDATYGPVLARWTVVSSPQDANYMAASMVDDTTAVGNTNVLKTSTDGGATWTTIASYAVVTIQSTEHIAIAGNNKNVLYIFGSTMQYSDNFGATLDDRSGNLSGFGPGSFIGIAGGAS